MIGEKLSPVLVEIEDSLWEHEANNGTPPRYTDDGFRAICKIFMSGVMDKMWKLQGEEGISFKSKMEMATKAGEDIRKLVKTYTNIDTHKLY